MITPAALGFAISFAGAAVPVTPVATEKDCFANMMCTVPLKRGDHPHEWPFSLEAGELSCVAVGAERGVFFSEVLDDAGEIGSMAIARQVIVTTNPIALLVTADNRELHAPYDSLETLIGRLGPYQGIGLALCPQPAPKKDI